MILKFSHINLSLAAYVPYQLWVEIDPRISALLFSSLSPYRHELLLDMCEGIPIQLQHLSLDDNVPAFHSRRMNQLASWANHHSQYTELDGKGHWFEGIMTTQPLLKFYDSILNDSARRSSAPDHFQIVVANPGDTGSRGGVIVDQLINPGQLGRIEVEKDASIKTWFFKTSNVYRFSILYQEQGFQLPDKVTVDGQLLELSSRGALRSPSFFKSAEGLWSVCIECF